jgi:hypothetical protein
MARDSSPKERQLKQLERKLGRRASYDRILIVSEGSKTEPNYFSEIRRAYKLHTANVEVRHSEQGTAPVQVVQYAKDLFEIGDRNKRIQPRAFDRVYAVFDRDEHASYFDALQMARSLDGKLKNGNKQFIQFRAIASVPSFELWLLLHYEDIQHSIHRHEVLRRLKAHIPGYDKGAQGTFLITKSRVSIAMERAQALSVRAKASLDREPFTAIDELVRVLTQLRG